MTLRDQVCMVQREMTYKEFGGQKVKECDAHRSAEDACLPRKFDLKVPILLVSPCKALVKCDGILNVGMSQHYEYSRHPPH